MGVEKNMLKKHDSNIFNKKYSLLSKVHQCISPMGKLRIGGEGNAIGHALLHLIGANCC
jgi:hypothetical protein